MSRQVLIVDDAATVRMYHRNILVGAGFAVDEAANGIEALELGMQTSYELLVVDVNMPRMDGYTLVEELRSDGPNHATPVVIVSTEGSHVDAERAYAAGANFFLTKPVAAEELVELAELLATPGQEEPSGVG